ncbi:TPA: hypothetical protein ACG7RA_001488 [Streptococcus agalactiae]
MKKIISSIMSVFLALLLIVPTTVNASSLETDIYEVRDESYVETINSVDKILQKHILFKDNKVLIEDEDFIIDELNKLDLSDLENQLIKNGMSFDEKLNGKILFEMFVQHLNNLNRETMNSNEIISIDKSTQEELNSNGIQTYSSRGNVNSDTTYWWGRRRLKSKRNATKWAADIRSASHANAAAGIGLSIFGGVAGIPNGLTAVYGYNFADRVDYHNGRTDRGIQADIHWTLTFSIKPQ